MARQNGVSFQTLSYRQTLCMIQSADFTAESKQGDKAAGQGSRRRPPPPGHRGDHVSISCPRFSESEAVPSEGTHPAARTPGPSQN